MPLTCPLTPKVIDEATVVNNNDDEKRVYSLRSDIATIQVHPLRSDIATIRDILIMNVIRNVQGYQSTFGS